MLAYICNKDGLLIRVAAEIFDYLLRVHLPIGFSYHRRMFDVPQCYLLDPFPVLSFIYFWNELFEHFPAISYDTVCYGHIFVDFALVDLNLEYPGFAGEVFWLESHSVAEPGAQGKDHISFADALVCCM